MSILFCGNMQNIFRIDYTYKIFKDFLVSLNCRMLLNAKSIHYILKILKKSRLHKKN